MRLKIFGCVREVDSAEWQFLGWQCVNFTTARHLQALLRHLSVHVLRNNKRNPALPTYSPSRLLLCFINFKNKIPWWFPTKTRTLRLCPFLVTHKSCYSSPVVSGATDPPPVAPALPEWLRDNDRGADSAARCCWRSDAPPSTNRNRAPVLFRTEGRKKTQRLLPLFLLSCSHCRPHRGWWDFSRHSGVLIMWSAWCWVREPATRQWNEAAVFNGLKRPPKKMHTACFSQPCLLEKREVKWIWGVFDSPAARGLLLLSPRSGVHQSPLASSPEPKHTHAERLLGSN